MLLIFQICTSKLSERQTLNKRMELKIGHLTILPFHPWQNPLDATQKIIKDMLISSKTFKRSNKMKKKGYMKRSLPWAGEHKRDQRLGVFFCDKILPLSGKEKDQKKGAAN